MKITMLGSGAWGTALANLLCENGHQVTLWSRSADKAAAMEESRVNPRLQGVPLHPSLHISSSLQAVGESEMVVFATPSFAIAETARLVRDLLPHDAILVSVTKGIEAETGLRMTEILRRETGRAAVALSGPSHAEEVSRHLPTGCVAACEDGALAEAVQDVFMGDYFRVYASVDVVGVELSAAMKNVIALCAGISDGLGLGDNSKALLVTRGLTELARLGISLGGRMETFSGLAGVGDMIVTCTSMHSRNRRAGILIGRGIAVQQAMEQVGAVVEGYYAARSAYELSRRTGVDMPICREAYQVLYERKAPKAAVQSLMQREKKHEFEDSAWT